MNDSYDEFPHPTSARADTSLPDPTLEPIEPHQRAGRCSRTGRRRRGRRGRVRRAGPAARTAEGTRRPRLRGAHTDPTRDDPPPDRRPRPARAGRDRHRQDRGVRPARPAAASTRRAARRARRRWSWCRPASSPCRSSEAIFKYGRELGVKVVPVYGGQPIYRQLQALDRGVHVVVATPGRALDHIGRGSLRSTRSSTVILDEADEMLDMGFADDIESILESDARRPPDGAVLGDDAARGSTPSPSATNAIRSASRSAAATRSRRKALVRQSAYMVQRAHKPAALGRILDIEAPQGRARVLPHAHRGRPADRDDERPRLPRRGAARRHGPAAARSGHGPAARRHRGTARRHRRRRPRARRRHAHPRRQLRRAVGAESYVHRIGRVGRAGREGVAITLGRAA